MKAVGLSEHVAEMTAGVKQVRGQLTCASAGILQWVRIKECFFWQYLDK